ncbi:Dihydrodipicolinate synthetase-like protein [Neofusicoccum parvum]|uniref:Dihydrodipicolinate synthetase-like protein n=1 Tax=Neofusicoccum parvum TaxID=310453 RepID=A0ACB5RPP6_9PEZI|nr:Dihydrodipicolinate synthetase-like protein [Neofusicoccum parvum]
MSPHNDAPSPTGFAMSSGPVQAHLTNNTGRRPLPPGVYVPTVAFFDPVSEDLDLDTTASHAVRLAQAGVAGIATQGSNGEAVHLSHKERNLITSTTRRALDAAGFTTMPVIVGCGAQSTRETIELCVDAQEAGGDYALVLPPAYYQGLFSADSVSQFFKDVASASPIPILIYNYPGAVSGLDLSSDAIVALAAHPNIVGCKLTCGNTGKLARVAAATRAATPSDPGSGFMCMGGSADFTLQTLVAGGSGIIGGLANVAPKACVALIRLHEAGGAKAARDLQAVVARGDWAAIRGGIVGTKSALMSFWGYGGYARKPLPRPGKEESLRWRQGFEELVEVEKGL